MTMFADDSTVYYASDSCDKLNHVLSRELDSVYKWVSGNKLALNLSKTKSMIIGSKQKLRLGSELKLHIARQRIQRVEKAKLLGLVINSSLSWTEHINTIVNRMGCGIALTKKCCNYVNQETLKIVINIMSLVILN